MEDINIVKHNRKLSLLTAVIVAASSACIFIPLICMLYIETKLNVVILAVIVFTVSVNDVVVFRLVNHKSKVVKDSF